MTDYRDFLSKDELAEIRRFDARIAADKIDRRRIITRGFVRMHRERARLEAIRSINERLAAE